MTARSRRPPLDEMAMECTLEELRDGESVTLYSTNSRTQIVTALTKLGATSNELKRLTIIPIGGFQ